MVLATSWLADISWVGARTWLCLTLSLPGSSAVTGCASHSPNAPVNRYRIRTFTTILLLNQKRGRELRIEDRAQDVGLLSSILHPPSSIFNSQYFPYRWNDLFRWRERNSNPALADRWE